MSLMNVKLANRNIPLPTAETIRPGDIIDGLNVLNERPKIVTEVFRDTFSYCFLDNVGNKSSSYFWGSYETLQKDNGKPVKFYRRTEQGLLLIASTEQFSKDVTSPVPKGFLLWQKIHCSGGRRLSHLCEAMMNLLILDIS